MAVRNSRMARMEKKGMTKNDSKLPGVEKITKRGSVNNRARLDSFATHKGKGSADWGACDPVLFHAVVVEITGMGGAITFGLSRDLGAHFLTLLLDKEKETLWFNGDADLSRELQDVLGKLEVMH